MSSENKPEQEIHSAAAHLLADAIACHQAGRLQDAERLYRDVLDITPEHLSALYRLGVLYFQNNRVEQALPFLESALKLQPQNPNILSILGAASHIAGHDAQALQYLRQALAINPTDAGILSNLGKALREQGDFAAALECFTKIDQAGASPFNICIEIGRCHYEMERFQEAIFYFEKALEQKSDSTDALCALSSTLSAMGDYEAARARLECAAKLAPHDAKILLNLGEFLAFNEGKIDEALGYFNQALSAAPDYNQAMWRKSFALLAKGEYREGWRLYAACLGGRDTRGFNRFAPAKPWNGAAIAGKHLLIWCEQGLGDSLQFIRFAALCKQRAGKVSVFCQKPLVRLFKNLPFIDEASDACERGSFDEHVPIMSLPHLFDTVIETIPADPYLRVDPSIAAQWTEKFADAKSVFKVGLVWAGGGHEDNLIAKLTDRKRSIKLAQMQSLFGLQGIEFYSLQKDRPAEQIQASGLADRIVDFMGEVEDFADTAALIQNLDLVITVDTSAAHLAGGLGKPVWILSRYNTDWRWLQNRPDSPWYPSARIFGQPAIGDWDSVIKDVEQALVLEVRKRQGES